MGGPLRRYRVVTGHGVETVMKLNEQDADRLGALPVDDIPEPGPKRAGKARSGARNKAATGGGD
ncbi:hypothetical protein ACFVFS_17305 [Kitasatospora sp. NPDC057692]|uniref:hypothetical protein n=1 Tax=Kitasatospora sp. NPDC057692 TaxID=3346215 RepID=UPI003674D6A8